MSQHDFEVTTADANTGVLVRAAYNSALQALASLSSGATAPSTTYPYQIWADTTTGLLKIRNAANSAWISVFSLADPSATTTQEGIVELATDAETITGTDTERAITPSNLTARTASTTATGIIEIATDAEAETGTDTSRAVTAASGAYVRQRGQQVYAADAGSNDTYAITLAPAPTAYVTGMVVNFKANTANTGACTLNVNSLGAKTIKKNYNSDLADNDILANQLVSVIYDGTNFQLLSPVSNTGAVTAVTFLANLTSDQNSVTGDGTTWSGAANVWTEVNDSGSNFNASTGTFTAPSTGLYVLSVQVYNNGVGSHTMHEVRVITSNRTYYHRIPLASAYGSWSNCITVIADMDASDTVYFEYAAYGSTKAIGAVTPYTRFSGHKI